MKKEKIVEFTALAALATQYLPPKVYEHSIRVMTYIMSSPIIPEEIHDDCIIAAIAHDLIEDTSLEFRQLPISVSPDVMGALKLLTKPKEMQYIPYIKEIKRNMLLPSGGQIAYWVKLADMKDHLAQKDTLTDTLKEKYLEALPFLLP